MGFVKLEVAICPLSTTTLLSMLVFLPPLHLVFFLAVFLLSAPPSLPTPLPIVFPFSFFDVFAFTASERSLIPSGHNREGGAVRKSISICAN